MITPQNLFHLSYYEKAHFTGSLNGLRFYIEKIIQEETPYLRAWIYPGPFCFEKTEKSKKQSRDFPFSENGLAEIADWINLEACP